jgi:hypothetical protein
MSKPTFTDPDLHTPAHDAIMLWLDANVDSVIRPHLQGMWRYNDSTAVTYRKEWETPIDYRGGARYIDMLITASWGDNGPSLLMEMQFACEVKPVIRSVGELIRQLRQYEKPSSERWKVVVVSPDDRFASVISEQGFIFIKAPQPEYGPQAGLFQQ